MLPVPVAEDNVELAVGYGAELEPELLNEDEAPPEALDCDAPVLR
jgi:hypothetical protein